LDTASRSKRGYATIKIRNVAAIPPVLAECGADPANALRRSGLDPDLFSNSENLMPFAALGRLLSECVRETGRDDFGFAVGARTKASSLGLTSLVSINSPTVRDALMVVVDTLKTSGAGRRTFLEVAEDAASFGYAVVAPGIESVDQIVDGAIAIAFNLMRRLCGPSWRPLRVKLTRNPPRDPTPFSKFFAAPIDFAEPAGSLVFDAATLDEPVRDRNPEYAEVLAPLLKEAVVNAPGDFLSAVKGVIRSQIGAGALSRDRVCRALGLNARTLAHRLEAFGVTYSGLADEARYGAAQSLLKKDKKIAEIAVALGYAEQSAFTRAFKAWSGTTPARWRSARHVADG
jgi:AraC-like DNA-binding protein